MGKFTYQCNCTQRPQYSYLPKQTFREGPASFILPSRGLHNARITRLMRHGLYGGVLKPAIRNLSRTTTRIWDANKAVAHFIWSYHHVLELDSPSGQCFGGHVVFYYHNNRYVSPCIKFWVAWNNRGQILLHDFCIGCYAKCESEGMNFKRMEKKLAIMKLTDADGPTITGPVLRLIADLDKDACPAR